jgi:hypothetical protein
VLAVEARTAHDRFGLTHTRILRGSRAIRKTIRNRVVVQFNNEASQTRDYWLAQNATFRWTQGRRTARLARSLATQKTACSG